MTVFLRRAMLSAVRKTVVEAVAYSKQVADAMDDYMKGLMHERDL